MTDITVVVSTPVETAVVNSYGGGAILVGGTDGNTSAPPSTETTAGIAEIATQAEVDTGTDDSRIVTPLKLKQRSPIIPYRSGVDITLAVSQLAPTTASPAASAWRAAPWIIYRTVTIVAVRLEITTFATGNNLRLALYQDDSSGYPGALVANSDSGNLSGAANGVQLATYSAPITLSPGLYWQVSNSTITTCTCRAHNTGSIANILGAVPTGGSSHYTAWSVGGAIGTPPSTYPAGASPAGAILAPMVMYRVQ
jgi:hypothetical protein